MPSYTFKCQKCGYKEYHNLPIRSRDDQHNYTCKMCEDRPMLIRGLDAPAVMQVALPFGTKRNDKGYQDMKTAAKLRVQQAGTDDRTTEYKEMGDAIRKLEKADK